MDWNELDFTELDLNVAPSEWHFTLVDSIALPSIALHLTHRDCIELEITRQIEIHRTVLQWAGLDWTGMDYCTWLRMEIHCNLLAWMGLHLSGRDWTVVRATRLDWTRRHCTSLHWIVIDCT